MESLQTKTEFIELRAGGLSYDKISKKLGVAKQTLIDWGRELQEQIANAKGLELEALYEKYYLLKEHRIETFGSVLSKLKAELENRDLSEIPTDKLVEMLPKYHTLLQAEIVEPTFRTTGEIESERAERELLSKL